MPRKRKVQGPSLAFGRVESPPPLVRHVAPLAGAEIEPQPQDTPEVLGDDNSPDIVRSKDLKAIAARGDQLRRLGKAVPLCWLPGDPETSC